jgi:hypothetical protein
MVSVYRQQIRQTCVPSTVIILDMSSQKKKIKCALIFLNTILVEKGDKKKQMWKNMRNLLKMCPFPQYSLTPPSCNTKLVQPCFVCVNIVCVYIDVCLYVTHSSVKDWKFLRSRKLLCVTATPGS